MWTKEIRLAPGVHGSCEAESARKTSSRDQRQQRATFIQVFVFVFLADDGVWSQRELSTKQDSLALLSAPLLLRPLYQELCISCRPHVLKAIEALEGLVDGSIERVESAHRVERPVRLDRPKHQAKRVKPTILPVPAPESDLKYMF